MAAGCVCNEAPDIVLAIIIAAIGITGTPLYHMCGVSRMQYYVYILSDKFHKTIYTGVTNDLLRRLYEHRHSADPNSFTSRYHVDRLVYYEVTSDVYAAISREKQIKSWSRSKKNRLIESKNPTWQDLYPTILP